MSKYYKLLINEKFVGYETSYKSIDEENYIICRFYPLLSAIKSRFIFKEIVTNKMILDSTYEPVRGLTYTVISDNNTREIMPCVKSVSSEEVREWLKNMKEDSLKEYVERLNNLEKKAINYYDEYEQEKLKAKRSIKKALKK